jgi:hypothetical protein
MVNDYRWVSNVDWRREKIHEELGKFDEARRKERALVERVLNTCYWTDPDQVWSVDLRPVRFMEQDELRLLAEVAQRSDGASPLPGLTNLMIGLFGGSGVRDVSNGLPHLRELGLWEVPVEDISPLSNHRNLEVLDLRETRVTDLSPLAKLQNLRSLDLRGTNVTELAPLADLTNLKQLLLSRTQVRNLAPLKRLSNLELLILDESRVRDLQPLAGLLKLREISFKHTRVTTVRPLENLVNLGNVRLAGTAVRSISRLSKLPALKDLDIRWSKVRRPLPPLRCVRVQC